MPINYARADLALCVGTQSQFPRDPRPEVALSGRSNVGKSSFINTLLGRKSLARVSSAPGKTVTVNYYDVDGKFYLVDLPGYGYAKRAKEKKGAFGRLTDDFFTNNPSADALRLVVQLVDVRTGPSEDDCTMINFLIEQEIPFVVVLTKTDKLSKTALEHAVREMEEGIFRDTGITPVPFSSVTGVGKTEMRDLIERAVAKTK